MPTAAPASAWGASLRPCARPLSGLVPAWAHAQLCVFPGTLMRSGMPGGHATHLLQRQVLPSK